MCLPELQQSRWPCCSVHHRCLPHYKRASAGEQNTPPTGLNNPLMLRRCCAFGLADVLEHSVVLSLSLPSALEQQHQVTRQRFHHSAKLQHKLASYLQYACAGICPDNGRRCRACMYDGGQAMTREGYSKWCKVVSLQAALEKLQVHSTGFFKYRQAVSAQACAACA